MKNAKTLLAMSAVVALLSVFVSMPNSDATTSHVCSLSNHCYAVEWLEWNWNGIEGFRQEYGVKATQNVSGMTDATGSNNFIISGMWIIDSNNSADTWVELGVIQGDYPDCPTDAEYTKRYYWISWDGTYDANNNEDIKGGCVTTPSVSNTTITLEDSDDDGTWEFIVGTTTIASHTNDFGKGWVKIGMESTDASNTVDVVFSGLDYHDATNWLNWTHSEESEIGTFAISDCAADSFKMGSATCP